MKLVRESLEPLFEIGEANVQTYKISYLGKLKEWEGSDVSDYIMIGYEFLTEDKDKYIVTFLPIGKTQIIKGKVFNVRVDFLVSGVHPSKLINKGRIFKVFSTICVIIKDYLKRNPQTFSIVIIPGKTEEGEETRFKLYQKYVESQMGSEWRSILLDNSKSEREYESSQIIQLLNDQKFNDYKAIKKPD